MRGTVENARPHRLPQAAGDRYLPICAAVAMVLTAAERHQLKKMAYGRKTPHQARQRATVVLLAARGRGNARIAAETHLHVDTVRTWRGRFAHGGLPALADRKRSGRPSRFTPVQVAEAKVLACQLPAESGIPLSRWSCPELAAELTARGITATVSASTVRRWLREDALKPWQYQTWVFITDPAFRPKAQRVLDLYARTFEGELLGADEYVISADEKTSIQARCRCHPTLAPGQARAMRVFWIVDNGSSHRGRTSIDRLAARFPNATMVHTPVHASWLNQIEIFFSIVQRKVVAPNDFTNLDQVRNRLRAFEDRYNATAQPFQWKFTTSDLDALLARLDRHQPGRHEESSTAPAT